MPTCLVMGYCECERFQALFSFLFFVLTDNNSMSSLLVKKRNGCGSIIQIFVNFAYCISNVNRLKILLMNFRLISLVSCCLFRVDCCLYLVVTFTC